MSGYFVNGNLLLVEQDIHAEFQRCHRGVYLRAEQVREVKFAVRGAEVHRSAVLSARDRFAGKEVVHNGIAAVRVAGQRVVIQHVIKRRLCDGVTAQFCEFAEYLHPSVQLGGAVVAVNHRNRSAVRGGHYVYLRVVTLQRLVKDEHCKYGSSGGHVARAREYAVCRRHSGACVALRRADGNSRLEVSARVEELCALGGQDCFPCACVEYPGEDFQQFPGESLISKQFICLREVLRVVPDTVNREYSGGFANADLALSGQLVVDKSCQGVDVRNILDVLLAVEHRLVEVRNAPALRNVESEKFRKFGSRRLGDGISPCAERNQQVVVLIERHVAVHHAGYSHCAVARGNHAVFALDVLRKACVAVL